MVFPYILYCGEHPRLLGATNVFMHETIRIKYVLLHEKFWIFTKLYYTQVIHCHSNVCATYLLIGRMLHQWLRRVGSILCNTHKKQRRRLRVLSGPNCCKVVGVVGAGSTVLPIGSIPSSSLIIID